VDQVGCINPKPRASQPAHVIFIFITGNAHKQSNPPPVTHASVLLQRHADTATEPVVTIRDFFHFFLFFPLFLLLFFLRALRRAISRREGMEMPGEKATLDKDRKESPRFIPLLAFEAFRSDRTRRIACVFKPFARRISPSLPLSLSLSLSPLFLFSFSNPRNVRNVQRDSIIIRAICASGNSSDRS